MDINPKEYKSSELTEILITCDGQGKKIKEDCLNELLSRSNDYSTIFEYINTKATIKFSGKTWGDINIYKDNMWLEFQFNSLKEAVDILRNNYEKQ